MIENIEKQIQQMVDQRITEILKDPALVIANYEKLVKLRDLQLAEQKPKVDAYDHFLASDGYASCAIASEAVKLNYIDPQGKIQRMGQNMFIQVLAHDGIIEREPGGYRLLARYRDYGRTKTSEKNGKMKYSVQFNARGLAYLVNRYMHDTRVWRSVNGKLGYTVGLREVGRESQEPDLQVEESLG